MDRTENSSYLQTEFIKDCRSGDEQVIRNIERCEQISDFLSSTLGPFGLDKLFFNKDSVVMSNDGAFILKNTDFKDPIGRLITCLSQAQDTRCGDGTTSVVLLGCELLRNAKRLVNEKIRVEDILRVFKVAKGICRKELPGLCVEYSEEILEKLIWTTLNSKNVRNERQFFSKLMLDCYREGKFINYVYESGGSFKDSISFSGVAFEKTFTYAGYEQQPKRIERCKIAFVKIELEHRSEKESVEVKLESVEDYKSFVDVEHIILKKMMDDLIDSGAKVVLSSEPIGDLATQYFASHGVFSAGRVDNLSQIAYYLGGKVRSSTKILDLGWADLFEEKQLGDKRFNFFYSQKSRCKTIFVRAPTNEMLLEVSRSLEDAHSALSLAIKSKKVVCGGGSIEIGLSKIIRDYSSNIPGKEKAILAAAGVALEKIPMQLCNNLGKDGIVLMQELRLKHAENKNSGVGTHGIADMNTTGVYEPLEVKESAIAAGFEVAEAILMIDGTIMTE